MKLGTNQLGVLKCLQERERGFVDGPYGSGWVWGTQSGTKKILESLVKKGLVTKGEYQWRPDEPKTYPQYTISQAGSVYLLGR